MVMPDYTPCHRASESEDRDALDNEASERDLWLDEPLEELEEVDFYEALDDNWLIEDLSDRAQADEQPADVRSPDVPFPELIEAAIRVMQAAQDAGIDF